MDNAIFPEDAAYTRLSGRRKFLIIWNVSKRANILNLISTAYAYGFTPLIVGLPKLLEGIVQTFGGSSSSSSEGSSRCEGCCADSAPHDYILFKTSKELSHFLSSHSVRVLGIEIMGESKSVLEEGFAGPHDKLAFMPGNEGVGLSQPQKNICNGFVYIPQPGTGTASLNVTIATTIILHRYCSQ